MGRWSDMVVRWWCNGKRRSCFTSHTICLNQFPSWRRTLRLVDCTCTVKNCWADLGMSVFTTGNQHVVVANGLSSLIILKPQRYNNNNNSKNDNNNNNSNIGLGTTTTATKTNFSQICRNVSVLSTQAKPKQAKPSWDTQLPHLFTSLFSHPSSTSQSLPSPTSDFQAGPPLGTCSCRCLRVCDSGLARVLACQLVAITVISAWRAVHAVKRANTHTDTASYTNTLSLTRTHTHTRTQHMRLLTLLCKRKFYFSLALSSHFNAVCCLLVLCVCVWVGCVCVCGCGCNHYRAVTVMRVSSYLWLTRQLNQTLA